MRSEERQRLFNLGDCSPRYLLILTLVACLLATSTALTPIVKPTNTLRPQQTSRRFVAGTSEEVKKEVESEAAIAKDTVEALQEQKKTGLLNKLQDKIGIVENDRFIFPEYNSGEVPRMFSSLKYNEQKKMTHAAGSVLGAAALVAGTTVGAGVLALPAATVSAGFLPSTAAMLVAYAYMTMSGLLIAELTLNRMAATGKPGKGILDLFESSLGKTASTVGSAAYFFLHYAVMVAYIAQGGNNLADLVPQLDGGAGQVAFAGIVGAALFAASKGAIEKFNNVAVAAVVATFGAIMALGVGSADFGALIDPVNQHPEQVVNCFPILFLAFVYQNIVPTVVTQLEGDRTKIIQAIIAGTTTPLLMFLAWNAVILGNVMGTGNLEGIGDPVALLQSGGGGAAAALGPLVAAFSSLALVTSVIGFTYGLVDAWTDIFKINADQSSKEFQKWKPALFGLVFLPPLGLSVTDPDIFMKALEYGGAFGVSTLFLVLPPIMVWNQRYGDAKVPLLTKPMVPLGKIPLGSMWKAAGTLILEQGAEKLGVFDAIHSYFS